MPRQESHNHLMGQTWNYCDWHLASNEVRERLLPKERDVWLMKNKCPLCHLYSLHTFGICNSLYTCLCVSHMPDLNLLQTVGCALFLFIAPLLAQGLTHKCSINATSCTQNCLLPPTLTFQMILGGGRDTEQGDYALQTMPHDSLGVLRYLLRVLLKRAMNHQASVRSHPYFDLFHIN